MRFVIEMNLPEAVAARKYLNADEGLRNQAAEKLLRLNKPLQQEAMAAVVNGLAAISAALHIPPETNADSPSEYARTGRVEAGLRGML